MARQQGAVFALIVAAQPKLLKTPIDILQPMDATTLHCPSCGAAISSDSTQCQYCHSVVQSVACPSCFGLMFQGSKFCPHCGAVAGAVDHGPAIAHPCPRCADSNLQKVVVGTVELEECLHCGGLWVASQVFNKICADREAQEATVAIKLPATSAPEPHTVRYLKCPQCANLMNRFNFAHGSGVVIDKCANHGLWLDRDDLRRVIEFIRAGGLTVAREHEIQELKEQTRQLESDRVRAETGGGSSYYAGSDTATSISIIGGIAGVLTSFSD
jgi:Zn-finger nucleic acid-binding protein